MAYRTLRPLTLKTDYYTDIEREIARFFYLVIFKPLFGIIRDSGLELRNSITPLVDAILSGRVYQDGNRFYGNFSASITRELKAAGAQYDGRTKSWQYPSAPPPEIQIALANAQANAEKAAAEIIHALDSVNVQQEIKQLDLQPAYDRSLKRMNQDFIKITEKVAIAPKLTPQMADNISKNWAENLDIYIKDFADEKILELRKMVSENAMRGQRSANMVKTIQAEYGVSQRKAKFLARKETSLLMSEYQEQRYKSIGIEEYIWDGVNDARERPDHKELNGKIFTWDSPPVTNRRTGARNHPGKDFGCRCVARAVIRY